MRYTVFVSYSWKNDLHRVALLNCLNGISNVEVKLDKMDIHYGGNIWDKISKMLDESDCVITILSEDSKNSFGVYQELVRAHDRGIEIIPLCHTNIREDELPPFIRPLNRIPYSSDTSFIDAIGKLKLEIEFRRDKKTYVSNPRKRIQNIVSAINNVAEKQQSFRLRILDQILETLNTEIKELSESYTLDLGIESNFLLRARPLFNSAERVFAVSIDYVSTFWLNQGLVEIASQYIRDQSENTIRLFVFENAAIAHTYSEVLEAHHRKYGTKGAVLLCSLHNYKNLLRSISSKPDHLLENDFAVLEFEGFKLAATLDNSKLHFHQINYGKVDSVINLNHDAFVNIMSSLAKTGIGELNTNNKDKISVLRWSSNFLIDKPQWVEHLKLLFKSDLVIQNKDLHHLVFLRKKVHEDIVFNVRNHLLEAKANSEVNFVDVWLGRQLHIDVTDGNYHGAINTGSRYDLGSLFIFHFKTKDDLRKYYSSQKHSTIRRELYESFSKEIKEKFREIDMIIDDDNHIAELYEQIEKEASQFIERYDYIHEEKIDEIVKNLPYKFPYDYI